MTLNSSTPVKTISSVVTKRKAEVFELLKTFPVEQVRSEMNEVIAKNRGCTIKAAGDVKTLYPSEVEKVLACFDK